MRIAITGAGGLIGSTLLRHLRQQGHDVIRLVRTRNTSADAVYWNSDTGDVEAGKLDGLDAVVHLAGENLAAGRWTAARKARIRQSRVAGTDLISRTLADLKHPPAAFVMASAVGYYGHRGAVALTEASPPGTGFLAEIAQAWEQAAAPASACGIRVVQLRFGMVLTPRGGALGQMLPVFRAAMGGVLGDGTQYWSWVSMEDVLQIMERVLTDNGIAGPVNVVAPEPVTNREFTKCLGQVLSRPTVFRVPASVLRLILGEMAEELLLASVRAEPARLKELTYRFRHPRLIDALRAVLSGRPTDAPSE